ncbi:hypothetical protein BDZ97DRAFT_1654445 [Flammula alnicola]|nr:hypothetical protein BDZ97DRAFT_1654445 [Flammula alnicola]
MFAFQSFTAVLAFFALVIQASPLSRRDVITPNITSPTADSVWPVGSNQTVTWDTSNFPPVSQITNILGKVILGFNANNSLNLDFNNPLAQNFNLTDGSVQVTVPNVQPRNDYLIVLFGDSGDTSPAFSITLITGGSSSASTTATLTDSTPLTTPTSPASSVSSTHSSSSSSSGASPSPSTTSAAWSLHEPDTMSFKALSVCMAAMIMLIMA